MDRLTSHRCNFSDDYPSVATDKSRDEAASDANKPTPESTSEVDKEIRADRKRVVFLGRFPAQKEVGGVTTFTYGVANENKDILDSVVDFYPAQHKIVPKGVAAKFITGSLPVRILRLLLFHLKANTLFHHNYSTVRGLLPLLIFPQLWGTKWMLTLHNGDLQEAYDELGILRRAIVRRVLKRFDVVGSISEKQDEFYSRFSIRERYRVSPFVKAAYKEAVSSEADDDGLTTFLIAGFPTHIYRHLETIDVFRELWQSGRRFKLTVCLYGYDTDGIENQIREAVGCCPFATLQSHLDATEFQEVLKKSDVYVRMNAVDSYGLIVAEAITLGVTAIATDVCARYPGTLLIGKDDFALLRHAIVSILHQEDVREVLSVAMDDQAPVSFRSLYKFHSEYRRAG
ncbi:MAG: glycosyltransferase [Planctomycetota bacterium]